MGRISDVRVAQNLTPDLASSTHFTAMFSTVHDLKVSHCFQIVTLFSKFSLFSFLFYWSPKMVPFVNVPKLSHTV